MAKILSHGTWLQGPDATHQNEMRFLTFAREDGVDWYEYAHAKLVNPDTVKILVRDGVVAMVERDGTMIVPPGEIYEAPASFHVERGWLWQEDRVEPPPLPEQENANAKLATFLQNNPDVAALIR